MLYLAARFHADMLRAGGGGAGGGGEQAREARGEALREALLANANLGGDCCNRGMMLGGVLGAVLGRSGIPADLLQGLARRQEALAAAAGLSALCLSASAAAATAGAGVGAGRLGRPLASPLLASPSGALGALRVPVDFEGKLRALRELAAAEGVPVSALRFFRHLHGAAGRVPAGFVAQRDCGSGGGGAPQGRASPGLWLRAVYGGDSGAAAARGSGALERLEEGVAVRDRIEALAGLQRGGVAAAAAPAAAAAAAAAAAPPQSPAAIATCAGDASPHTYPSLAQVQACLAGEEDAVGSAWWCERAGGGGVRGGTGVFFYPQPVEMAARMRALAAAAGGVAAAFEAEHGVQLLLRGE